MNNSNYGLGKTNVLFITLDCCRYDTFIKARLPFIKNLGKAQKAKTHGTYTLPAHMSFFMGYLPTVPDSLDPYYAPDIRQLWRLRSSRPRNLDSVGIMLDGKNILEGYRKLGFSIIGTGGVRWFTNNTLTNIFDRFEYFGSQKKSVFLERKDSEFPLNQIPSILKLVNQSSHYFLFINCPETHVPYDFGEGLYSNEVKKIIEKYISIWGCKTNILTKSGIDQKDLKKMHSAQIKALESIDLKIQKLIGSLNKPLLLVMCGDHGECFGENNLWGHGFPHNKVMEVPLFITMIS